MPATIQCCILSGSIAFSWGALFSPRICFWRFFSFFGSHSPLKIYTSQQGGLIEEQSAGCRKALEMGSETTPPEHRPRATDPASLSTLLTSSALMRLISLFPYKGKCGGRGCQANQTMGKITPSNSRQNSHCQSVLQMPHPVLFGSKHSSWNKTGWREDVGQRWFVIFLNSYWYSLRNITVIRFSAAIQANPYKQYFLRWLQEMDLLVSHKLF